jgi:tol-pal system protein YbgF
MEQTSTGSSSDRLRLWATYTLPVKPGEHWRRRARAPQAPLLRGWRWLAGVAGIAALYSSSAAYGAAPVEESVADDVAQPRDSVSAGQRAVAEEAPADASQSASQSANQSASQLGQLFYQLQLLRDEVQRLNGALEEQQNQIERLAREQHERYLGLDRRIAELGVGATGPTGGDGPIRPGMDPGPPSQQPDGPATERGTYETAYELMQRHQYGSAAEVFQQLIDQYPNGQYTPNAFYWLGELHRKNGDPEAARQSFVLVVDLYPEHNKVPDALYKLGVVYTQLDEPSRALEYLDRVVREYPDSTAASLAKRHAAELR